MMNRSLLARVVALVGVVTLTGIAGGCSSDGSSPKSKSPPTTRPAAPLEVTPGTVTVASAGSAVQLADADRDAIISSVGAYINAASLVPLTAAGSVPAREKTAKRSQTASTTTASGAASGLDALFAAGAAPALAGPERDSLVDTGVGPATGTVKATVAPVNLVGLADRSGTIDLIGTTLDLTITTTGVGGPISIHRAGELMFIRDGGRWAILGFKLAVTRQGSGLEPVPASTTRSTAP